MRGRESGQVQLFSYVDIEARIPATHPLRAMKALIDPILAELSPTFDAMYAADGRPSIPPEQLLRALVLQILYTVRSERLLMEQLDYNLLFRWFAGLDPDEPVWHPTTFTANRDRFLTGAVAAGFFERVRAVAERKHLLSSEHFTVDGTLLEAWASQKSFCPKGEAPAPPEDDDRGNPTVSFRGQKRSNATHASTTDPDARLARKGNGKEAKLSYEASVTMENRYGLVVATAVDSPGGRVEKEQALAMLGGLPPRAGRRTVGGDKRYDDREFVAAARGLGFTPHVARDDRRTHPTAIDDRTTRHAGYAESQRRRKRIEEGFGWGKTVGLLRKLRHRGRALVGWVFAFTMATYNLVRIRTLLRAGVAA